LTSLKLLTHRFFQLFDPLLQLPSDKQFYVGAGAEAIHSGSESLTTHYSPLTTDY